MEQVGVITCILLLITIMVGLLSLGIEKTYPIIGQSKKEIRLCEYELPRNRKCELIITAKPKEIKTNDK